MNDTTDKKDDVISEALNRVYDKAVDHCVGLVEVFLEHEKPEVKLLLERIISELNSLKNNKE